MRIVGVLFGHRVVVTDGGAAQAIAGLERRTADAILDQARFAIGITTRPAGMGRITAAMLHLDEIAHLVVQVAFDVGAHGVAVIGRKASACIGADDADAPGIVMRVGDGRAANLPQVFAASGLDEAVEGVVGVLIAGLDALVLEVDGLLGIVANVGDVARRVVGVVQVLHLATGPVGLGAARDSRRGRRLRHAG